MATEISPSSSDGIETTTTKAWTPDRGEEITERKSGPVDAIDALYAVDKTQGGTDSTISSLNNVSDRGRGTYTIIRVPQTSTGDTYPILEYGIQELIAMDVTRDITQSPYFKTLNYREVRAVVAAIRDDQAEADAGWSAKQATLFRHLAFGVTNYLETAFVFRRTRKVSSTNLVKATMVGINTVTATLTAGEMTGTFPTLAPALLNLILALPDGEWLKRPPQTRFLGRDGWEVAEEWQWAPEWSVMYGGTEDYS